MSTQLSLDEKKDVIETVVIMPTKEMPKEVFCELWRLSFYMELMDRVDENHVVWDEKKEALYAEGSAEAEYLALQNGWFSMAMEIPKYVYDKLQSKEGST